MSLNFDKVGKFLAKIDGGKYKNKIVSVSTDKDNDEITKDFTNLHLKDAKFQQIPNPDTEREILYITGASGSGKSHYTREYVKNYLKLYPNNKIYCFSALKEDETLDEINVLRLKIDDSLFTQPLLAEEFKDSLVIMDDIDCISNKKHRNAVIDILNEILETGRHFRTSLILTYHLATNGHNTRKILNECHSVTFFPFSGSMVGKKRLLVDYCGLDKATLKKVKNTNSRWCTFFKNYPNIVMTEQNIWLCSNDDDE